LASSFGARAVAARLARIESAARAGALDAAVGAPRGARDTPAVLPAAHSRAARRLALRLRRGLSANWFGLFQVPDLVSKDRELAALFKALHIGLVALLAALVALHVGAACGHELLLRDGVMRRMLPWKPRRND